MKRNILIATALLLLVPLLSGCGVPQEDLDTALAEAQAAKSQLASVQSDLTKAKSDLATAESDLAAAESDLAATESDLSSAQGKVSGLQSDLSKAESDLAAAQEQIAALEAPAEEAVAEEEEVAEEEVAEEEVAEEEVAELSFEAATYTNEEYGFSVKYPSAWAERPELVVGDSVASFGVPAFVPGMNVYVYDVGGGSAVDEMIASSEAAGNINVEVVSESETTLADGTPAVEGKLTYFAPSGYDIESFYLRVQKDDKWVLAFAWTIGMFSPYDETLSSEIVHTLTFE